MAAGVKFGGYLNKQAQLDAIAAGLTGNYEVDQNNSSQTTFQPNSLNDYQSFGDKYLNKDFLGGAGSVLQGFGSLASGWAAMKNLKLTKEAMDTQQNQWNTNYEAQRTATNNQIGNQNAWKQAQGRTDYGSYVGGKPSGTTYVG